MERTLFEPTLMAALVMMSASMLTQGGGLAAQAPAAKARCAVSGKSVEAGPTTLKCYVQGKPVYFCSEKCPTVFRKTPERFVTLNGKCPIFGTALTTPTPALRLVINNGLWYVCCPGCVDGVKKEPSKLNEVVDVVSGSPFLVTDVSPHSEYQNQSYYFENAQNKQAFDQNAAKYAVLFSK